MRDKGLCNVKQDRFISYDIIKFTGKCSGNIEGEGFLMYMKFIMHLWLHSDKMTFIS